VFWYLGCARTRKCPTPSTRITGDEVGQLAA
jgi:hypothetical protein